MGLAIKSVQSLHSADIHQELSVLENTLTNWAFDITGGGYLLLCRSGYQNKVQRY